MEIYQTPKSLRVSFRGSSGAAVRFFTTRRFNRGGGGAFSAVNRLTGFVKPGGTSYEQNRRMSTECDRMSGLANGRVKSLTKTDFPSRRDSRTTKRASCFYNFLPSQFGGHYKNWVFSNPVEVWGTASIETAYGLIDSLMEMDHAPDVGGFARSWEAVYQWFFYRSGAIGTSTSRDHRFNPGRNATGVF